MPKQDDAQNIKILILDDNDLQKIDNIDSYLRIEKVIPTHNLYNFVELILTCVFLLVL